MSNVEDILMEAWDLGINTIVMEKASKKHEELRNKGIRVVDINRLYEEALKEAKNDRRNNGSRN
jgi:predicted Fe-Mo cluster-binding NifX family protein